MSNDDTWKTFRSLFANEASPQPKSPTLDPLTMW
eukprot:CAMPEP_0114002572 /NCGR_PEP_ID=MMETSP0372-20130328/1520_1 /TAXON_ID=340204 /ORGANISM="Lankesteria abbotti" /LENGTH=33 /assembly_acc=CAM_ASM_000359